MPHPGARCGELCECKFAQCAVWPRRCFYIPYRTTVRLNDLNQRRERPSVRAAGRASLYTCLQILSVSVFEKTQLSCALRPDKHRSELPNDSNQLILFDF